MSWSLASGIAFPEDGRGRLPFGRKPGERGYESKGEQRKNTNKRKTEMRNPINLFIKRFSCFCRSLSCSHGKYEALKRVLPSLANLVREGIARTDRMPADQPKIPTPNGITTDLHEFEKKPIYFARFMGFLFCVCTINSIVSNYIQWLRQILSHILNCQPNIYFEGSTFNFSILENRFDFE